MNGIKTLIEHNRAGKAVGLPCFCTANEFALQAILEYAASHTLPVAIEATCNQVNQQGGYTGMTPAGFIHRLTTLADKYAVSKDLLIAGGDHLGPNPWRHLPAEQAMKNAQVLVKDYVTAGFRKIHLDASMACAGEPTPSFELVAERAAQLCRVAEDYAPEPQNLIYIIGTEVPVPGGETEDTDHIPITTEAGLQETIDTHQLAFERNGLSHAWPRIVSIVVQPGVDFSHTSVHRFDPAKAIGLKSAISEMPDLTLEAHSTDYQPASALAELVASHCFFLKVGPELTFRMREALFALASIEKLLLTDDTSELIRHIDNIMNADPGNWATHYQGDPDTVYLLRHYSYSDRIRYYWNTATVSKAVDKLISNLERAQIPATVVSQFFPTRKFGSLDIRPQQLIWDHIKLCIKRYYNACGHQ